MDARVTISILYILSASSGIVFNGFILLVLLWQRRIHTASHLLLFHLAILDTLFCFAVITFTSLSYSLATSEANISWINLNLNTLLQVQQFTWITLSGTLMWTLTGLSCDRYTAICFPFTYSQLVSRKKVLGLIATSWISSLVLSIIPLVFKSAGTSCIRSIDNIYPAAAAAVVGKSESSCFPFSLDPTFLVLSLPLSSYSSASPEVSFTLQNNPPSPAQTSQSYFTSTLPLISSSVWPLVAKSNETTNFVDSKLLSSNLHAGKNIWLGVRCFLLLYLLIFVLYLLCLCI